MMDWKLSLKYNNKKKVEIIPLLPLVIFGIILSLRYIILNRIISSIILIYMC
jgi:hypothetical protein